MRILSAEAMREVDRAAIETVGIPSLVLMENAALGLTAAVVEMGAEVDQVVIFCGPGNNGGDGFALARQLDARGYGVTVFRLTVGKEPAGDGAVQLAICHEQGIGITEIGPDDPLDAALASAREADLVVDALFGTGLGRPLQGQPATLVEALSALPVRRLAVDLPSGLNGTRSDILGPHFEAHVTVTFAAPKRANVLLPAAAAGGELVVANLGIPPHLVEEAPEEDGRLYRLEAAELALTVPVRRATSHKGTYGHAVVAAGSPGKAGAVILAARGAVRAGAGLVTAAVPEPLVPTVDLGSLESMTLGLAASPRGTLTGAGVDTLLGSLDDKDALALGPGLGTDAETATAIRRLVLEAPLPVVVDADGINAFAGSAEELSGRCAPTVLTPHPGELARLLGTDVATVQGDRLAAVRQAVEGSGATVVLKGHQTLVAEPPGPDGTVTVHLCPTGNPGMATGGSGDVLTGLVVGLLSQLGDAAAAARLGVFLHGLAGDVAAGEIGPEALAAADLLDALPGAWRCLEEG